MVKKFVLVSGGVISGIGKGIIASSTGLLLKTMGLKVTSIKIDPYLNIDAGTMSPLDHGKFLLFFLCKLQVVTARAMSLIRNFHLTPMYHVHPV